MERRKETTREAHLRAFHCGASNRPAIDQRAEHVVTRTVSFFQSLHFCLPPCQLVFRTKCSLFTSSSPSIIPPLLGFHVTRTLHVCHSSCPPHFKPLSVQRNSADCSYMDFGSPVLSPIPVLILDHIWGAVVSY